MLETNRSTCEGIIVNDSFQRADNDVQAQVIHNPIMTPHNTPASPVGAHFAAASLIDISFSSLTFPCWIVSTVIGVSGRRRDHVRYSVSVDMSSRSGIYTIRRKGRSEERRKWEHSQTVIPTRRPRTVIKRKDRIYTIRVTSV